MTGDPALNTTRRPAIRKRVTGAEAVVLTLAAQGIDTVFGIPGAHTFDLYAALARQEAVRHVLGRHEQGLGYMADGYSRASGKIGAVTVTSGPAVANLASALGGATTDTSSVLVVASAVHSELVGKNRGGLHDLNDASELMRSVCRHVRPCRAVEDVPTAITELVDKLRSGRPGSAFCDIPVDVLAAESEVEIPARTERRRPQPDPAAVSEAVKLLAGAKRPVIWAGTGATISGAGQEVDRLARRLGAIVLTSALGRGLVPADHPNHVTKAGVTWIEVAQVIADADVTLAVGTMFKQEDTANWKVKPGDKLIHIDIDPEEIGRSYDVEVGMVADAKAALSAILRELPPGEPCPAAWIERGKEAEKRYLDYRRHEYPVDIDVLERFRAVVPRDAIVVCDRCSLGYWAWRCMPSYAPRTFQYPMGYGGLGGALPQAIGAKLSSPAKAVVCVIGDGGFQFTAPELGVAVQENVDATVVICNNAMYGAIDARLNERYGVTDFGCKLHNPDFRTLAAAYGIPCVRADNAGDFEKALDRGIRSGQLNLVELVMPLQFPRTPPEKLP